MYIVASDFFEQKTINTYLKLEIRVLYGIFSATKSVFSVYFEKNQMISYTSEKLIYWYTISI